MDTKDKLIEMLEKYKLSDDGDVIIYTTEFNKFADEILALTKEQESITDDQELFNKIERKVSDYLKAVGSVNRKDCIEHDFRQGISLGLFLRNQFKTK